MLGVGGGVYPTIQQYLQGSPAGLRPQTTYEALLADLFEEPRPPVNRDYSLLRIQLRNLVYGSTTAHEYNYKKKYKEHNKRVLLKIPPKRLLVMDIASGDGWEKLCPLGVATPSCPFPTSTGRLSNYRRSARLYLIDLRRQTAKKAATAPVKRSGFQPDFPRSEAKSLPASNIYFIAARKAHTMPPAADCLESIYFPGGNRPTLDESSAQEDS